MLPVLTGLGSVYWAKMVGVSWLLAPLSNILGYTLVFGVVVCIKPGSLGVFPGAIVGPGVIPMLVAQVFLTAIISLSWMFALDHAPVAAIGFVEISYPLFILLFSALLMGGVHFQPLHWIGCGLVLAGAAAIVLANLKQATP